MSTLRLNELDLNKILRFHAEVDAHSSAVLLQQTLRTEFLRQVDPQGTIAKIESQIQNSSELMARSQVALAEAIAAVEGALGIKLSDYVIDDRTGELAPKPPQTT